MKIKWFRMQNTIFSIFSMAAELVLLSAVVLACAGSPAPVSAQSAAPADEKDAGSPSPIPTRSAIPADELDAAIRAASTYLNRQLPKGNKLVILNIQSEFPALSEYIIDELIANTVNDKVFSVVDRQQLNTIRAELEFQTSGEVDDNTAQTLGRMAGAQVIISGAVSRLGDLYRLRVRALSVETAQIAGQFNRNIPNGPTVAALVRSQATGYGSAATPATSGATAGGSASTTVTTPAATPVQTTQTAQTPVPETPKTYKIGEAGPAGGLIFYDKGNDSGGWRYLEAAPAFTEGKALQWSVSGFDTGAKGSEVGTGKQNTRNIMDASVQAAVNAPAARLCDRLAYGGYDDWYLPSKNELGLMYMNLKVDGIGVFANEWYWSSSEGGEYSGVWAQNFGNGQQYSRGNYNWGDAGAKTQGHNVRACRQF
ncbi:MAG: DUF1566 domain-containing protein [Treponema sp.]|jgi:hypothetical protein|nr:DUF1566 domain-containing protein [Treponema sp.]